MKSKVATVLCLLTLALFVLMFIQERSRFIKLEPLKGVYYNSKPKALALNYLREGSYQSGLEEKIRFNFGFREPLIRTYNQYLWDFYHKTLNKNICVGKENWLYGTDEVRNYYQSGMYDYTDDPSEMRRRCKQEAARLIKVQRILDDYGNFVFVTLLPTKSLVFPEYLPENPCFTLEPFHLFDYYPRLFDSLGVNYVNVLRIFQDWKGRVDFPLYPKTGKHWSYIASGHAFDTIERYVESRTGMNLHNYMMGEAYPGPSEYPDNDHETVLNLWRPIRPNQNYYASYTLDTDSTATRSTALFVGDSYFWNLTRSAPLAFIFSDFQYWYYNRKVSYNPDFDHTDKADILRELLNARIIDLTYSPEQLYGFSNGFLSKALLYLTHEDAEIDSTMNAIADTVVADNDSLRMSEARKQLFSEPERYFPDLDTDTLPTTRNSRIPDILRFLSQSKN